MFGIASFGCIYIFLRDIPIVQSYVEGVLDILLTGGENTGGSSVELRNYQMATALMYFAEAPWVGHGIYYTMNLINEMDSFTIVIIHCWQERKVILFIY